MRKLVGVIVLLALAGFPAAWGKDEETVEQLIARADAARPDQQPDLYMQAAQRELKSAVEAYKTDRLEDFRVAVQQTVKYSDSAHAAAIRSNKHLKPTEIKIRQIAIRLRDVMLNVDADEQPGVQAAIDRLEGFRTELLQAMFGSKGNEK